MKKTFHFLAFLSLILGIVLTSCVSNKKFMASEAQIDKLQKDNTNTISQMNDCNAQIKNLKAEKASLQYDNELIQNDLKAMSAESKMTIADQAKRLRNLQELKAIQIMSLFKQINLKIIGISAQQEPHPSFVF